jgi:hypothetical protein
MEADMWKGTVSTAVLLLLAAAVYSQQTSSGSLGRAEWEYLVISYGKTYFADPIKSQNYAAITAQAGQEAVSLQKSLDGLGKLGWELVAVIGNIGGDQELLLKRKSDPSLGKKEQDYLAKQSAQAMTDLMNRYKKQADESAKAEKLAADKKILVDLDLLDAQQKFVQEQKDADDYIKQLIDGIVADELVKKEVNLTGLKYSIRVQYDLTSSQLSNTNEYRKSLIDAYLEDAESGIYVDTDKLSIYDLDLILEAYLKLNGKPTMASSLTKQYGILSR